MPSTRPASGTAPLSSACAATSVAGKRCASTTAGGRQPTTSGYRCGVLALRRCTRTPSLRYAGRLAPPEKAAHAHAKCPPPLPHTQDVPPLHARWRAYDLQVGTTIDARHYGSHEWYAASDFSPDSSTSPLTHMCLCRLSATVSSLDDVYVLVQYDNPARPGRKLNTRHREPRVTHTCVTGFALPLAHITHAHMHTGN